MAIFFADGFDQYGTGAGSTAQMLKRTYSQVPQAVVASPSRNGSGALNFDDALGGTLRLPFAEPKDVLGVAVALWLDNLPSSESATAARVMRISDTFNTQLCAMTIATTGAIRVRDANGNIIHSSPAKLIVPNGWTHIEAKFTFLGVFGQLEVRVNEVTVIDLQDINIGNPATAEQLVVSDSAGNSGIGEMYIDDLVLWDDTGTDNNDFLGDVSVFTHYPNGDTVQDDWTLSTGSDGYILINSSPATSDYIEATVVGDRSDFEMPAFSVGNITGIRAVQRFTLLQKNGAGEGTFKQGVVSNAVDAFGAIHSPGTAQGYYLDVFERNPDGNVPWDVSAIEDMLISVVKES